MCPEATIAQHCGVTALGCTINDLVTGAQGLGFNAALLAISGEPDALAALSSQTPFIAMIDLASLYSHGPMFQWHFVVPLSVGTDRVVYHDPAEDHIGR